MDYKGFFNLVKNYRENEMYLSRHNGMISIEDAQKTRDLISEQGKKIDFAVREFLNPECEHCASYKTCTMPRQASIKCFEV